MTLINIIDARPGTPLTIDALLDELRRRASPEEPSELEKKLSEIEARLKTVEDLHTKLAETLDKLYALEAKVKSLEALIVALYNAVSSATPPEAKVTEQTPKPTQTDPKEVLKSLMPTEEEIERMVLKVLYKRMHYWHGRANLPVDEKGYVVIGRDTNFGARYSRFVAIMAKYGLSDWVIARGNDQAGYYVEVKASDFDAVIQRLKAIDESLNGALSKR